MRCDGEKCGCVWYGAFKPKRVKQLKLRDKQSKEILASIKSSGDNLPLHVLAEHLQRNTAGKETRQVLLKAPVVTKTTQEADRETIKVNFFL